jgi:hypothetical protein
MKTFEQNSIKIGKTDDCIVTGMAELSKTTGGGAACFIARMRGKRAKTALHVFPKPAAQAFRTKHSLALCPKI